MSTGLQSLNLPLSLADPGVVRVDNCIMRIRSADAIDENYTVTIVGVSLIITKLQPINRARHCQCPRK